MAILRVNQLDIETADAASGWMGGADDGASLRAKFDAPWPDGVGAFELRVIPQEGEPVFSDTEARRRVQRLICETISALVPTGHMIVSRVDGPLVQVLPALGWAIDRPMGMSPVRRFSTSDTAVVSLRVAHGSEQSNGLCDALGPSMGRNVRLRSLAVPHELASPLLDMDEPTDERWRDVLAETSVLIDTAADMHGLVVYTRRSADDLTHLMAARLAR